MELEETSVSLAPVPSDSISAIKVSKQTDINIFIWVKFIGVCHSLFSHREQTDREKDIHEGLLPPQQLSTSAVC